MPDQTPSSLFDTPEEKAVNHAYAVLRTNGYGEASLSSEQRRLLRELADCRGLAKAKPIGHLVELLKTNPRALFDCRYSRSGLRALEIAKLAGCTRNEARLSLQVWMHEKFVMFRSSDGRYFYHLSEPWKAA